MIGPKRVPLRVGGFAGFQSASHKHLKINLEMDLRLFSPELVTSHFSSFANCPCLAKVQVENHNPLPKPRRLRLVSRNG
jgi:hypothetical protein